MLSIHVRIVRIESIHGHNYTGLIGAKHALTHMHPQMHYLHTHSKRHAKKVLNFGWEGKSALKLYVKTRTKN